MNKKQFFVVWAILFGGMIAGIWLDLPLSVIVYDPDSFMGKFINAAAMVPSFLMLEICCCIRIRYNRDEKPLFYMYIAGGLLAGALCAIEINRRLKYPYHLAAVIGIVVAGIIEAVCMAAKVTANRSQYVISTSLITSAIGVFVITCVLKYLWGRLRFYGMEDPLNEFTSWLFPSSFSFNDLHHSFPSGHTSFASLILYAAIVPDKYIKRKIYIYPIIIWIIMVMFGRIVFGAHFLSDTCAGAIIGMTWVYWGYQRLLRRL